MDRGEILRKGFRVMPGEDGSFVVRTDDFVKGEIGSFWGLNDIDSLIKWLVDQAEGFKSVGAAQKSDI